MEVLLERPVLVLNRLWQPVHTCSVRRALKLLCLGHAQVVQTEGEALYQTHDIGSWVEYSGEERPSAAAELIRSVKVALRVPKIIVLAIYDRIPRKEVKFTRQNVFLRDKYTCQYCAKIFPEHKLNLDHVLPRDKGGKMTWKNIVSSCFPCNTRKANRHPRELGMRLLAEPRVPKWRPLFGLQKQASEQAWQEFISPDRKKVSMAR
ncbi:MAG: 5-methylcytosine-specific restriction endonuclease McrA [Akkermansiaceae bacterium]|jgi:5-methylcytosine-specific restriction endonuclease McrA|tara:strand:- start:3655 stop:4272 length:618 start_codon:yes stop_codon:yes gene_type:complete